MANSARRSLAVVLGAVEVAVEAGVCGLFEAGAALGAAAAAEESLLVGSAFLLGPTYNNNNDGEGTRDQWARQTDFLNDQSWSALRPTARANCRYRY